MHQDGEEMLKHFNGENWQEVTTEMTLATKGKY